MFNFLGINIAPGFMSNVAIEKTIVNKLPSPYNDCMDNFEDPKYDYLIEKSNSLKDMKYRFKYKEYDQNLCMKIFLQRYIFFYCNCTDFTLPRHTLYPKDSGCNTLEEVVCAKAAEAEFFNSDVVSRFRFVCPDKCSFTKYDAKVSSSRYPTAWHLRTQNISLSMEDYRKHVALVNIYYNDMMYTRINQNPAVTREALFGNLGGKLFISNMFHKYLYNFTIFEGQFGLFMGISVLSTIEVVELAIILYMYVHRRIRKKT